MPPEFPARLAISFVPGRSLRARTVSGAARVFAKPAATLGGRSLRLPWPFALAESAAKRLPRLPGVVVDPIRIGDLHAEIIRPERESDPGQILLYLHGGGFYVGGRNTHRRAVSHLVRCAGQPALVVDYRQCPRFPVSQSVTDCVSAFAYLLDCGYPADRISIVGDSAGGFLAVSTAIVARQRNLGTPAGLVCWSPGLDFTISPHRRGRPRDPLIARRAYNALCRRLARMETPQTLGVEEIRSTASLLTADVTGLPPTLIQVGSHEFIAEDAVAFAHYLAANDVTTTLELWDRQIHIFPVLADLIPEGMAAMRRTADFLSRLPVTATGIEPAV